LARGRRERGERECKWSSVARKGSKQKLRQIDLTAGALVARNGVWVLKSNE
jgi:hypothetical protein